ncbi:MAG: hypothetical protein J4F45_07795 [Pseudomonadales bacterium]|nr:hypothetical protein [Pseudomonadales bacterium]
MGERFPGLTTYRGNGVVVTVSYDFNRSYELSLDLGQESPPMFSFDEVLRSCNAPAEVPSSYQITDESKLLKFIGELATSLRSYCSKLLVGDTQAFRCLNNLRVTQCNTFNRERELGYARQEMKQAWSSGDYQGVIDALTPHEYSLTKAERIKLAISRKKLGRTG